MPVHSFPQEAIQQGFYGLKDMKVVLEQSLVQTRAVLSVNDIVHTWHRGVQYNVRVSHVEPEDYGAVVCINTDITVDFAAAAAPSESQQEGQTTTGTTTTTTHMQNGKETKQQNEMVGGGYTLGDGGRTLASVETTSCSGKPTSCRTILQSTK